MPFTPAHVAAVLPFLKFNKRYVSGTALVAGSMAPDFQYFLTMQSEGKFSHSLLGIVVFDVPVVILLSLVFHEVVKMPLLNNLPIFIQRRFASLRDFDFVPYLRDKWAIVVISAMIGTLTHIGWDGFTHAEGFFVNYFSGFYHDRFVPFEGARYPLWYALQHISSYVGLFALMLYIIALKPSEEAPVYKPALPYWLMTVVVTGAIVTIRFVIHRADYNLGNLVVTAISGFCLGLIVMGITSRTKLAR